MGDGGCSETLTASLSCSFLLALFRAAAWALHMKYPSGNIHLLRGLQCGHLLHHGVSHGLQGTLCSVTWSTSSLPPPLPLVFVLLLLVCVCFLISAASSQVFFCPFLRLFSRRQRYHVHGWGPWWCPAGLSTLGAAGPAQGVPHLPHRDPAAPLPKPSHLHPIH